MLFNSYLKYVVFIIVAWFSYLVGYFVGYFEGCRHAFWHAFVMAFFRVVILEHLAVAILNKLFHTDIK